MFVQFAFCKEYWPWNDPFQNVSYILSKLFILILHETFKTLHAQMSIGCIPYQWHFRLQAEMALLYSQADHDVSDGGWYDGFDSWCFR